MTTPERRCGTCRFLHVPPDKSGQRVVRPYRGYECRFVVPAQPLPDSVTRVYGYRTPTQELWMEPTDGTKCPVWEPKP